MRDHWHIVYVRNSLLECAGLFESAGFSVRFNYHQRYPNIESEAAAYFDEGHGSIQSADPDRLIFKDNELLRQWRSLAPVEARAQIVLVSGDGSRATECFALWQRICGQFSIVCACPRCSER